MSAPTILVNGFARRMGQDLVTVIYGLTDPRDAAHVHYVGQTMDWATRYLQHLNDGRVAARWRAPELTAQHYPRHAWLASLVRAQLAPTMLLLEVVEDGARAAEVELAWIRRLKEAGQAALNVLPGKGKRRRRSA